jgi:hypothetical protein
MSKHHKIVIIHYHALTHSSSYLQVVAKLFISSESSQESVGLVYQLGQGSEVKVVVGTIQTTPGLAVDLASENLSFFSAYFLG